MLFLQKHHRLIFYVLWILLGLMQSALTELQDDEAYYWVFSKYPDWGYFDHPPLIALLIKAGNAIFPGEFGVRIFPFLLHLLTLFILDALTGKKNPALFYAMALSIVMLQLTGFMAVPDTALIFATALFFLSYRDFIRLKTFASILLLAFSSALLLYSKYHGGLVILFTILSNTSLLKNYRIYLAGTIALLLFLPHLYWQYDHGWVSFRYHLFESNVNEYEPGFTLSYLAGQILLAGPVAGFILIPAALLLKPGDNYEKALRFSLIGIYLFFFLSSFRGKVEMNWTAPVLIPLFILSFRYLNLKPKWSSLLIRLLPVSLLLVLFARLIMIVDIVPVKTIQKRYHAWKEWPTEMRSKTGGRPVVFSNSYQRASKYWFYTGQMTFSQNLYKEHRNQYNFWPVEDSLLGKQVYYMDIFELHRFRDSVKTPVGWVGYRLDSNFSSFTKVQIIPKNNEFIIKPGAQVIIEVSATMPTNYCNFLKSLTGINGKLIVAVFNKKGWLKDIETGLVLKDLLQENFSVLLSPQLPEGNYKMMFSLEVEGYYPTHNGPKFSLRVE